MSRDAARAPLVWNHYLQQHLAERVARDDDGVARQPARQQHLEEAQPADAELAEAVWAHLAAAAPEHVDEADDDGFIVQHELEELEHNAIDQPPHPQLEGLGGARQLMQATQATEDELPSSLADWIDENWDADKASTLSGEEELFSDDEVMEQDTTDEAHERDGRDMQGIPWDRLQWSREGYRARRLEQYPTYQNQREECERGAERLREESLVLETADPCMFKFSRNFRRVQSSIVHFQLRNLLWATSPHDVYVQHRNCILHWNTLDQRSTKVLDVPGTMISAFGPGVPASHIEREVQVSTMCVRDQLVAAGGFRGELVVKRLDSEAVAYSARVTDSENGITNGIDIYQAAGEGGGCRVAASNNDMKVRLYDAATFKTLREIDFGFAVNYATVNHQVHPEAACGSGCGAAGAPGRLMAVVGDVPEAHLIDPATGKLVAALHGHLDYSFAAAWHPNGNVLATGNQDKTVRLWDIRYMGSSLAVLQGRMGAVRSLRFTNDGRYLAAAEPADFVHLHDVRTGYAKHQEIDVFGEIAGISFTPGGESLFVCIADITYGSLLQFDQRSSQQGTGGRAGLYTPSATAGQELM